MSYRINRSKCILAIQSIFCKQDNNLLQKLYDYCAENKIVEQTDLLKLWHGIEDLNLLSSYALAEILKFCLDEEAGKPGESYQDYLIEEDTNGIQEEYINSITNIKTRYATVQWINAFNEAIVDKVGLDLPQIKREDIINGIANFNDVSLQSMRQALSVARAYCEWCIENKKYGDESGNPFKTISINDVPIESWVKKNIIQDEYALSHSIKNQFPLDQGYLAPVVMALAWMGFSDKEMIQIKAEEADKVEATISGIAVPKPLIDIVFFYPDVDVAYRENGFGVVRYEAQETGFFLRRFTFRENKKKISVLDVRNAMNQVHWTSLNKIRVSVYLYNLYQIEMKNGALAEDDFVNAFGLNRTTTNFLSVLKEKRRLYEAYKKIFSLNA